MAMHTDIGVIEKTVLKKTYEEAHIEWSVPNFSILAKAQDTGSYIESPDFFINNVSWSLVLFPRSTEDFEFMRLYIYDASTSTERKYPLEYKFGLKKTDGSVEQKIIGIMDGNKIKSDDRQLIKRSEIQQRKSELAPQNVVTFTCTMRFETAHSTQPTESGRIAPMKLIKLDKLSEDFKDLFMDKETCDTILKVSDKEYRAHRSVLIARSNVFAATFKHDTLERQTGVITIPDCDPDSFAVFLEYLYSGKLEDISCCNALNLYYASNKYDIPELKTFCIECLIQHLTVENICEIAVFADKYDETELFTAIQDFFNKNMDKVFVTSKWQSFMIKENRLANKFLIEMSKVKVKG